MQQPKSSTPPLEEDAERGGGKKSPTLGTVADACNRWAEAQRPGSQAKQAARDLAQATGTIHPRQLNAATVAGIIAAWQKRYERSTLRNRTYALRCLLRHLETAGAPTIKLPAIQTAHARTVTLKAGELEKLIAAAPPYMQLFLFLCSHLALRFMEAYELTPGDHDPEQHTVRVRVKGGASRTLPTSPQIDTLFAAARLSNPTGRAIETLRGRTMCPTSIRIQFGRLVRKCGVTPELSPHDLRRTTATALYAVSKDIRAVQQLLGHNQMTSTLHYIAPLATEQLSPLLAELRRPRNQKETVQ